jgi:hypothetical protein
MDLYAYIIVLFLTGMGFYIVGTILFFIILRKVLTINKIKLYFLLLLHFIISFTITLLILYFLSDQINMFLFGFINLSALMSEIITTLIFILFIKMLYRIKRNV